MIEGWVWGGACELVMSCDVVFAAEEATFAITPARLGVPYDIAGALNFMQRASLPIIKEMLFTARPMSAQRALQVGIVNQVFPAKPLESATYELATQITRNSPLVIALLKEELRMLSAATPLTPEGFERIQALRRQIYDSAGLSRRHQGVLRETHAPGSPASEGMPNQNDVSQRAAAAE